jgi:competence protein ComEA
VFHDAAKHRAGSLLSRLRLDPGRRSAVSVGVAAVVVAIITGAWVWSARPHRVSAAAPLIPSAASASERSTVGSASPVPSSGPRGSASSGSGAVVVDVAGKVRRPGLVRLPSGARAYDAVQAAGGALPGVSLDGVNLAARVSDGQQIMVGPGPLPSAGTSGSPATVARAGPVDLNSAGPDQLQSLPGVGPVLAQHILDWRAAHGQFSSVDQLSQVPGIGPAKFAALKDLVSV